jgi:hypothetical protein
MNTPHVDQNNNGQAPLSPKTQRPGGSIIFDPDQLNSEQFIEAMMAAVGLKDRNLAAAAFHQLVSARGMFSKASEAYLYNAIETLANFRCKNAAELMMAAQIIATEQQAMGLLALASKTWTPRLYEAYFRMALNLLQVLEPLIATFDKCRRDGTYELKIDAFTFTREDRSLWAMPPKKAETHEK